MATRSTIAILLNDGTVNSIYCHWDGYISNNGRILNTYYSEAEKVKKLISLGSLSSLHENIEPSKGSKHSFNNPEKYVCVFYHRDRNESLDVEKFTTIDEYYKECQFEEFNYLFVEKENKWFVYDSDNTDGYASESTFVSLDTLVEK